jgi:hypothetical protein
MLAYIQAKYFSKAAIMVFCAKVKLQKIEHHCGWLTSLAVGELDVVANSIQVSLYRAETQSVNSRGSFVNNVQS